MKFIHYKGLKFRVKAIENKEKPKYGYIVYWHLSTHKPIAVTTGLANSKKEIGKKVARFIKAEVV
jgi:hypothetical protein